MEVLVVGAGVVGCAVAWRLSQAGARCTVLERNIPGAEASGAAGGILAPQAEADGPGPFLELCLASRALYPEFVRELREASDVDVAFRPCGVLGVRFDEAGVEEAQQRIGWQRARGLEATWLDCAAARSLEPSSPRRSAGRRTSPATRWRTPGPRSGAHHRRGARRSAVHHHAGARAGRARWAHRRRGDGSGRARGRRGARRRRGLDRAGAGSARLAGGGSARPGADGDGARAGADLPTCGVRGARVRGSPHRRADHPRKHDGVRRLRSR
jgi:glycine/D-amino acid oxidase-like deaminating enzyme